MADEQIVVPVDPREITSIDTSSGHIHIIHEITFGDLLVSTLLFAIILFLLVNSVIRR